MGSRDVFKYTDDFEDLVDLAGFEDELVKVTKYRTGLDPAINLVITASSDPPSLRDYPAWRLRAYQQYESQVRARLVSGNTTGRHPVATGRVQAVPVLAATGSAPHPRTPAPSLPTSGPSMSSMK